MTVKVQVTRSVSFRNGWFPVTLMGLIAPVTLIGATVFHTAVQ